MKRGVITSLSCKAWHTLLNRELPRYSGSCQRVSECSYHQFPLKYAANITALGSEVDTARDSFEFEKWHNGGGFFHKSARVDATAVIEIGAVVHSKSVVGANVYLQSGAVVGPSVVIGQSTKIGYHVALMNCSVGDSCIIHGGVCIGQDGFGFFVDEHGNMVKKPQVGEFL